MFSRWPPLPCIDEYRKCQSCPVEAADTCLSQRATPPWSFQCCLKSEVADEVPPNWKALTGVRGGEGTGGRREDAVTVMSSNYFLFFFFCLSAVSSPRPCLDPYIAWKGHKVKGGRG